MFCQKCGSQLADGAAFCMQCGTPTQAAPEAQPQAAQPTAPAGDPTVTIKKILHFIVAGVATLALILAIMNLFATYDVSISIGGYDLPGVSLSMLYDAPGTTFLMITNILYGLVSLAIAGAGVLYFLEKQFKIDLYSKFVYKFTGGLLGKLVGGDGICTLIGALGATAGLLQLIGFICTDVNGASVSMPFLSWLMLIVYIGIAVADILWLNKKKK